MATSYLDEYQALDAQPYQKAKLYRYLNDNIDQLQMTPEESYKFNWGADALSTDWITKKAGEIQKNVEESNSANILRRGLGKPKETTDDKKEDDKTDATSTDPAKLLESNGSGGDGNTTSPSSNPSNEDSAQSIGGYSSLSMTQQEGLKGAAVGALKGILGGPIGMIAGGINGYSNAAASQTAREAAATEARQMSTMMDRAQSQREADAEAQQQANFDRSIRDMEAGYGRDSGSQASSSSGTNSSDGHNTGDKSDNGGRGF